MKRLCLLWIGGFLLLGSFTVQAQCRMCYLTKKQAEKAANYLKTQKDIILFAGCELKDIARRVSIKKVEIEPTEIKGKFQIKIEGFIFATFEIEDNMVTHYTKTVSKDTFYIDLAYIHVRTGGYTNHTTQQYIWDATCLGVYLGYTVDPCIDPFDYPNQPR